MKYSFLLVIIAVAATTANAQQPSTTTKPWVVKTKQQIEDIQKALDKKPGNTSEDIVAQAGNQTRVAIFHDEKRVGDMNEVHDGSDDYYYVLSGTATLVLGGQLVDPKEVSPGEWRAKTTTGGTSVAIKKGDLVFVPRGTPHQRTVESKGFHMILVKIFAVEQPAKK